MAVAVFVTIPKDNINTSRISAAMEADTVSAVVSEAMSTEAVSEGASKRATAVATEAVVVSEAADKVAVSTTVVSGMAVTVAAGNGTTTNRV